MAKPKKIRKPRPPAMPKVTDYPRCTKPDCQAPYVLRRAHVVHPEGWRHEWIWQRDCRHKNHPAELVRSA